MNGKPPTSVIAQIRALVPQRELRFSEARRIAELQANKLRELLGREDAFLPAADIISLPRISVRAERNLPVSGLTHWLNGRWIIALNAAEPRPRQRFSLAHELFHVLTHSTRQWMHPGGDDAASSVAAEQLADYFAGCLLMPKRHLKRMFGEGLTHGQLATAFGTSPRAVEVRLAQLGLDEPRRRCAPGNAWSPRQRDNGRTYHRALPLPQGGLA